MTEQPVGPRCGNNPNARLTDGDRKAIENAKALLALKAAAEPYIDSAAWVDGDPLMEVIAAIVWKHCEHSGSSLVIDDPRTIAAFAAAVARAHAAAAPPAADQAALRKRIAMTLARTKLRPPYLHCLVMADAVLPELPEAAEAHRLALSEALGLGTGAPWDAIHDRATQLGLPPLAEDPVAQRLGLVPAPADRAAVLREAADAVFALDYDVMVGEVGDENFGSMREAWDVGTIHATELLRRLAAEAQQPSTETRTPCDQPNACDPDTGELCATHEEEKAHAEGEHEYCGVTCEVAMPTELMRNSLIAWAPPGGKGILAELERRVAAGLTVPVQPAAAETSEEA